MYKHRKKNDFQKIIKIISLRAPIYELPSNLSTIIIYPQYELHM